MWEPGSVQIDEPGLVQTRGRRGAISGYTEELVVRNNNHFTAIRTISVPLKSAIKKNMLFITNNVLPNIPKNLSSLEAKNYLFLSYFYYNLMNYINKQGYEIKNKKSGTYEFNVQHDINLVKIKVVYDANSEEFVITITYEDGEHAVFNEICRILKKHLLSESTVPGEGGRHTRRKRSKHKTKSRRSRK